MMPTTMTCTRKGIRVRRVRYASGTTTTVAARGSPSSEDDDRCVGSSPTKNRVARDTVDLRGREEEVSGELSQRRQDSGGAVLI
jgi:hypothetical protein